MLHIGYSSLDSGAGCQELQSVSPTALAAITSVPPSADGFIQLRAAVVNVSNTGLTRLEYRSRVALRVCEVQPGQAFKSAYVINGQGASTCTRLLRDVDRQL